MSHICEPVYVTEGEAVCLECGAVYYYHYTYDTETLAECRAIIAERESARGFSDDQSGAAA